VSYVQYNNSDQMTVYLLTVNCTIAPFDCTFLILTAQFVHCTVLACSMAVSVTHTQLEDRARNVTSLRIGQTLSPRTDSKRSGRRHRQTSFAVPLISLRAAGPSRCIAGSLRGCWTSRHCQNRQC